MIAKGLLDATLHALVSEANSMATNQFSRIRNFKKDLKRLGESLEMMEAFLQDAEEMQTKKDAVKLWLQRLKDVADEAADILDEYDYEILRMKLKIRNQIRRKVLDFLSSNNSILLQRAAEHVSPVPRRSNVETFSVMDESTIVGRENDVSKVVSVVPIVGMAGLGKTALAKLVYDDLRCEKAFCVKKILGAMFEQLTGDRHTSMPENMNAMIMKLKERIEKDQSKYLLVLDDLCLKGVSTNGGNGIIVTTRIQDVASKVQALPNRRHQAGRLEDEELPLVAKLMGGIMRKIEMSPRAWSKNQRSDAWGSMESVLKLSFDHLSSPYVKKCFAYCAMFPKDYCFGKEELIQLWTAEGFLGSSMEMVDIGDQYLNELLSNSLFQDVEKDKFGNILTLKMHDLVHDLSLSVSKFDTLVFRENSTLTSDECSHIRHLNEVAPHLHSLFSEIDVFKQLSISFTRLRVLKFVGANYILELPDSLGELKHLRYLDISGTFIKALPKSTAKLYHLQTLRLLDLPRLTLPDGLENLISLTHLYFDSREVQPDNIGNLTCLQTLPLFVVGSERGRSIKELGSLNELRGKLKICHLGGVRDKQEANGANLHRKEKLCKLIFDFEGRHSGGGYNCEEVMEGLQPHSNLQSLIVRNYEGESFPSWMLKPVGDSNTGLFLLNNLMELNFYDCINCESLPPLGQLHNLQFLELRNMKKVKRMGNEFYGNEGIDGMNKVIKVFPALKKFTLNGMANLKKWTAMAATKTIMFPCLVELNIWDCPMLKSVPLTGQCSSLEKLSIFDCKNLSKIGDGLSTSTCLKELALKNCPNLGWIPNLEGFSSLQNLSIDSCNELEALPITGRCSSLEKLSILDCEKLRKIGTLLWCPNLTSIPKLEGFSSIQNLSIDRCVKLEVLEISGGCSFFEKLSISRCKTLSKIGDRLFTYTCLKELNLEDRPNLSSIPNLKGFSCLQNLSIHTCNGLEVLPIIGACSSLEKLNIFGCEKLSKIGDGLSTSTCLKELGLKNCPNLSLIPNLEGFSCLQNISIDSCNRLEVLPIIGRCSSLEKLSIFDCKKLSKIGDGLSTSTCLRELGLKNCPNLSWIPNLERFSSLQILSIDSCNELEVLPITGRCSSLEKLSIFNCEKLRKIGDKLSTFICLKELGLKNCPNLSWIPNLEGFSSLQDLSIDSCNELEVLLIQEFQGIEAFPEWLGNLSSLWRLSLIGFGKLKSFPHQLQHLTALEDLTMSGFHEIEALPEWLGNLSSLKRLYLSRFRKLKSFPHQLQLLSTLKYLTIEEFQGIEAFPEWLGKLSSLRYLYLSGFGKLKSLPHQLQLPSALEDLTMSRFHEIEALPELLGNLSSLRRLHINSCNKLMYLPSVDVMRSLSKLKTIDILMCPQLETRCERESGPEWSKISHIPQIIINGRR
ncbi:hypothetical protein ES332_D03G195500v1 [Gossypium tomentosum]|uniref:Rx N-terminal domain-containing protein n=1 Tax=Gossypium tomentosum TaxID=34277 RepID=A0A5D2LPN0_GOSTO|nr:hypothetical protein ES332_D03G195500v1 [Gossypium tomentosum]